MQPVQVRCVAVVGGGLMGAGIAQVFAGHGLPVLVAEPDAAARATVHDRVRENLALIGQPADGVLERIEVVADTASAVADADVVFEAGPERLDVKRRIFADLVANTRDGTVLATNTSVIAIGEIAAELPDKTRVLGTHWWNPPYLVPLVEVVPSAGTDPAHVDAMVALLASVGKKPVRVAKDIPGFVGNRLQHALWREAIALVENGVCDARTVDDVVKNSFGLRLSVLGPLENADLVGLDLTLDIHNVIMPALDRTPHASRTLEAKVAAGELGCKTGHGFRTWTEAEAAALRRRLLAHLATTNRRT